jgi:hypothetical protein
MNKKAIQSGRPTVTHSVGSPPDEKLGSRKLSIPISRISAYIENTNGYWLLSVRSISGQSLLFCPFPVHLTHCLLSLQGQRHKQQAQSEAHGAMDSRPKKRSQA